MFAREAENPAVAKVARIILQSKSKVRQKKSTEENYFLSRSLRGDNEVLKKQDRSERRTSQIGANFALVRRHVSVHQGFDWSLPGWPSGLGKRLQTAVRGFNSPSRLQFHKRGDIN